MSLAELTQYQQHMSSQEALRLLRAGLLPIGGGDGTDDDPDDDSEDDDDDEADSGKTRKKSSAKLYSEADLESVLKTRLNRERRRLTSQLTTDIKKQLQADAESDANLKKGDLQKVIDDLKPKAESATALKERVDFFEELANTRFEEAIAAMPEALRELAPDDESDPLVKEKWLLTKAGPALTKLKKMGLVTDEDESDDDEESDDDDVLATAKKRKPGDKRLGNNPRMPKSGAKDSKRTVEEMVKSYKAAGEYRPLI